MLVSSLTLAVGIYALGVARLWRRAGYGRGIRPFEAAAFGCGWLAIVTALTSPLDELSERWLVAHMVQHELLMVVAAPLIAMSGPLIALLWALPDSMRRPSIAFVRRRPITFVWAVCTAPLAAFLLHALALWIWHLPALYDAALANESLHVLQHLCFFLTAALFWWGIEHGRYGRAGFGMAVIFVFATAVHSGTLGALLTLSPRVWYPPYVLNHPAGLTALEDQQLAGLVMWIPAGLIVAGGGLAIFGRWIRESDRHTRFRSVPATNTTGVR